VGTTLFQCPDADYKTHRLSFSNEPVIKPLVRPAVQPFTYLFMCITLVELI